MAIFSSFLLFLATLLLIHAAFSTVHYKNLLEEAGIIVVDEHIIPVDVKLEVAVSFLLGLVGSIMQSGEFVPASGLQEGINTAWTQNVQSAKDFHVYNHRAKYLRQRLNH